MLGHLVTLFISPLGTSLCLGVLALLMFATRTGKRGRRLAGILGILAIGWLFIWSTPIASEGLRASIEESAGPKNIFELPAGQVVVVLGGGVSGPRLPSRPYSDLEAAADRVWHASRLYHAGKASRLILSGGVTSVGDGSEAAAMWDLLRDLQVPEGVVVLEEGSGNTRENAQHVAKILEAEGIDQIILVTSALHMQRARRLFESTGLLVLPSPTDFEVIPMPFDIFRILPDSRALNGSARAFKELLGQWIQG